MNDDDGPVTTYVPDLELHRRTGEFRSPATERIFRLETLEKHRVRFARLGFVMALLMVGFSAVDLASLGPGRAWLGLLAVRCVASSSMVLLALGVHRDAARFLSGPPAWGLVAVQVVVLAAFLTVCAVRPADAVTHAVSAVLMSLVIGLYVPERFRTKVVLLAAFQTAFVVVALTRFHEDVAMGALVANLAAATSFIVVVVANVNRSQRVEWRANREQRQVNDRLREEARQGELLRAELLRQATQDPLTGLANRRSFFSRGEDLLEFGRRHGAPVTAVLMDADGFKQINDLHGHAAGDAVLQALGRSLRAVIRQGEVVGRIGGEEFAVVAEGLDADGARALAERMREAVGSTRTEVDGTTIAVTVSVGVTEVGAVESLAAALGRADRAMYEAKRSGGDRVLCSAA